MASDEQLEPQTEVEAALSDIDPRVSHPGRRASDFLRQPVLPQLGQIDLTHEMLDEIAWRVADYLALAQGATVAPSRAVAAPPLQEVAPPLQEGAPPLQEIAQRALPKGTSLVIRLRKPLFSWKLQRGRTAVQTIAVSDYRVRKTLR